LYVFFVTVNLGNMIVCYATLYRSEEVGFLMSMPITHAKIFLIKFVDNFFYSSATLSLVGFAVLLGYGSVFDLPWYFYLFTIVFVLLPFMIIAGIIAVMTLMGLIKAASRIGIRLLITIVVSLYLLAIYLYFRITNPVQLVEEVMKFSPDVNAYFHHLDPPFIHYLPNHWVTEFLYWSVNGEPGRAIPYFTLLFLTMLALIIVAGLMARLFYYDSWVAATEALMSGGRRQSRRRFRFFELGGRQIFRPQTDAILKRDVWLFFREPSQWLHLLLMILLLCIFLISVGALQLNASEPLMKAMGYLVVFLFDGFLIASVTLRFVFPTVSLEGDTFWLVRTSPVSLRWLYWHKFTFQFLLVLIVAETLCVASLSMLNYAPDLVRVAAVCTGFIALALTSLNLGAGTYFASFKEKNPVRVASSQGASMTFLGSMVFLALVISILVVPLHNLFESHLQIQKQSVLESMAMPLVAVGILSVVVSTISTSLGLQAIRRDL
jgi:ABC-2 type transport system permease protein